MTTTRTIPDAYTDYEDGNVGAVPPSLANVEIKIGAAEGGIPGHVYTLSGQDAKKNAQTIFQGGALLDAIKEAFDAGSTKIYAIRIGGPTQAELVLSDPFETETVRVGGAWGTSGNSHYGKAGLQLATMPTATAVVIGTGTPTVQTLDTDMEEVESFELPAAVASVVGLGMQLVNLESQMVPEFWVLGLDGSGNETVWHFDHLGALVAADTLDISTLIPAGDTITGLGKMPSSAGDGMQVTTDKTLLVITAAVPGTPVLDYAIDYNVDLAIVAPDISSVCFEDDVNGDLSFSEPLLYTMALDRTAKVIYRILEEDGESPVLDETLDVSSLVTTETLEGIALDHATGEVLLLIKPAAPGAGSILRIDVDWTGPTFELIEAYEATAGAIGIAEYLDASAMFTATVTMQDRNTDPYTTRVYSATNLAWLVMADVIAAIVAGSVYGAAALVEDPLPLAPDEDYVVFSGGFDGGALVNGDYLAGLEIAKTKLDAAWIHAVGATSSTLWTAILLHCSEMAEDFRSERFAILETPAFTSGYEVGTAGYLVDLDAYVETLVALSALVGDRNAVIFAGGITVADFDGEEYTAPITASCGGVMAGLGIQKSLINRIVPNALALVPEFSPGHLETLIGARINTMRFKAGRGFTITHSLTAAPSGSDYSRVNDLRAVYYGSKAAREAAEPYVGEENDSAGEGLRKLESAMSRPLENMRDKTPKQIDAFELVAVSTAANRLLGDVYVRLGITPMRAMEMIYTTVYLG
jgi:hypothetical protein